MESQYIKIGRGSWLVGHVRSFSDAEAFADHSINLMPSIHDVKARREYLKEVWKQCQPKQNERYGGAIPQAVEQKTAKPEQKKAPKKGVKVNPEQKKE